MVFWLAAAVLLVVITAVMMLHWRAERAVFRRQYDDPVMSHFYGAPAMGLMTVGAGAVAVGYHPVGRPAAVDLDIALWTAARSWDCGPPWPCPTRRSPVTTSPTTAPPAAG